MNTEIVLAAEPSERAADALEDTRHFIESCERRFSRFLHDSELSELNRSAGTWFHASADMIDLLIQARDYHRTTRGLFDPSILPDLERVGYDRSMDEIRRSGPSLATQSHRERFDFQEIEIDRQDQDVRLPKGMAIDLGGIGKGWIVGKASQLLSECSPNCAVSAGGDIAFRGHPDAGQFWQVRIEDPWDPAGEVARLQLGEGAVATSSIVKRSWTQGGVQRHHLIDPRTGQPAEGDWVSVTALASEITDAEVYAKALLIGGAGEASQLLETRPAISFFAIRSDGTTVSTFEQMEPVDEPKRRILH